MVISQIFSVEVQFRSRRLTNVSLHLKWQLSDSPLSLLEKKRVPAWLIVGAVFQS